MLYPEDKIFEDRNAKIENRNKTDAAYKMLGEVEDWNFKYVECSYKDGEKPSIQYALTCVIQDTIDNTIGSLGKAMQNPYIVGALASMIYQSAKNCKRESTHRDWCEDAEMKFDELDRFARKYIGPGSLAAQTAEHEIAEIHKLRSNQK